MTVNSIQHSLDSVKNNNSNAAGRMEHERIDNDVRKLLEMCGLEQEGEEQRLYDVLYYLLTAAICIYGDLAMTQTTEESPAFFSAISRQTIRATISV